LLSVGVEWAVRDDVVDSLKGCSAGAGDGFAREKASGVRADESVPSDEPDEGRENGTVTAFRSLDDGGRGFTGGGFREGNVDLGESVTIPPVGAPFLDEVGFGELTLVADGVGAC
jgi:hypothetical protein